MEKKTELKTREDEEEKQDEAEESVRFDQQPHVFILFVSEPELVRKTPQKKRRRRNPESKKRRNQAEKTKNRDEAKEKQKQRKKATSRPVLYHVSVSLLPGNPIPAVRTYPPVEHPVVVIGPQYLAQYPVELAVSTKLLTLGENDFKVSDINGTLIFQVKSKVLTLHDRRFLKDAAGNTLVNLRQKIMTMHRRWEAFRGESKEEKDLLFTAKKSKLYQFKTELDIFLGKNKGKVPDFKVKGGYRESSCSVLLGDSNTMLAQMHRKHTLASTILATDSFGVTVYPNVDYAFIMALVVILDEINADRSGED